MIATGQPGTDAQSCIAPAVCALPGGRWVACYRAARTKLETLQRVLITWSDDEGTNWSNPRAPFADRVVNGKRGQFRAMACTALGGRRLVATLWWVDASDPSKPFFNPATEGILDSHVFLATSDDGGEHWSEPWPADVSPFDRFPVAPVGPVLLMPNGGWACPVEVNKPYAGSNEIRPTSVMKFSRDDGKTWHDAIRPAHEPEGRVYYWDQRPAVLADGSVLDAFWTYDTRTAQYLSIHAAHSLDSGRTWSPPWDTGLPGQPAPPRSLADGRIALVYVDRTTTPAIKLRVSGDGGRTWPEETELVLHRPQMGSQTRAKQSLQDTWSEFQKYSVGLPDTCSLPGGDLLVAYYTGPHADQTNIEWARVSVLHRRT